MSDEIRRTTTLTILYKKIWQMIEMNNNEKYQKETVISRNKMKKELDFPQLIEWAINNEITRSINIDSKEKNSNVRFEDGFLVSVSGDIGENDRFTVEVEEKLTESTTLGLIILTFKTDSGK